MRYLEEIRRSICFIYGKGNGLIRFILIGLKKVKNIFSNRIAQIANNIAFALFVKGESNRFAFPTQISSFLFILISLFVFTACQEEIEEIEEPTDNEVVKYNSTTAALVKRVTLKDGSFDNILDRSSCSTVLLPITVQVNGQEVVVNSESDFTSIESIYSQSDADKDTIIFSYPFTVILADYNEQELANESELIALQSNCVAINDEDIECIDFIYPLTLSTYNSDNLKADVITKTDDQELYEYIISLGENDLVAFDFPMNMLLWDGQEALVNDNFELDTAIEEAINTCDEGDVIDNGGGGGNGSGETDLQNILLANEWEITHFFDETDKTDEFNPYKLIFETGGVLRALSASSTLVGEWEIEIDSNQEMYLELELETESTPLKWLDEEWKVLEFTASKVELAELEDNGEIEEKLTIEVVD